MDRRFHQTRDRCLRPGLGQIPRSRVADCSDPSRHAFVGLWFFFTHLPFTLAAARRQRFRPRSFHRPGRFFARADARLSTAGERKAKGRSEHRAIFYAGRLRPAAPQLARDSSLYFSSRKSSDRRLTSAFCNSRNRSALFPASPPSCSRIRFCKSTSARPTRRKGNTPTPSAASFRRTFTAAADQLMAKLRTVQGFRLRSLRLLQQHAESYRRYRSRARRDLWRFNLPRSRVCYATPTRRTTSI